MKKTLYSIVAIWFSIFTIVPNIYAEDYTKWGLPVGAKYRIGKGWINDIAYSPDGRRLALASSIGIWICDAQTGEELDLLTGHTDFVYSVVFSRDGKKLASGGQGHDRASVGCTNRGIPSDADRT